MTIAGTVLRLDVGAATAFSSLLREVLKAPVWETAILALRFSAARESVGSDVASVVAPRWGADEEALNAPGRRLRRCAKYPEGRRRALDLAAEVVETESCDDDGVVDLLFCFFGEAVNEEGTLFPSPIACFLAGLGFGASRASTVCDSAGRFLLGEFGVGAGETLRLGDVESNDVAGVKTAGGFSRERDGGAGDLGLFLNLWRW